MKTAEDLALQDWFEAEREWLRQRSSDGHITFAQLLREDTIAGRAYAKWERRKFTS